MDQLRKIVEITHMGIISTFDMVGVAMASEIWRNHVIVVS